MMEEDEASLHGVVLAAALTATARVGDSVDATFQHRRFQPRRNFNCSTLYMVTEHLVDSRHLLIKVGTSRLSV